MMKKLIFKAIVSVAAFAFFGCASAKNAAVPVADKNDIDKVIVVDWSGRTLGSKSELNGLDEAEKGNSNKLQQELNIGKGRIVKVSPGTGSTLAMAQTLSRTDIANRQATELQQVVNVRSGDYLNDKGELAGVRKVASETLVEISGIREEGSFWQKVRTTSAETKESKEEYKYWTIYSMSQESWNSLCDKFLNDMKKNGNFKSETENALDEMFAEIKKYTDRRDLSKIQ